MNKKDLSRRSFLKSLAATPLVIPALSPLCSTAFATTGPANHKVISIFLRGAMDSLSAVIPYNEAAYFDSRPTVAIPAQGYSNLNDQFALNNALSPLLPLYQQGELAFVVATGLGAASTTRSHFDAQKRMEGGTDNPYQASGWLGRYLNLDQGSNESFRAVSVGKLSKTLSGYPNAAGVRKLSSFKLQTPSSANANVTLALQALYADIEHPLLTHQAIQSVNALQTTAAKSLGTRQKPEAYGTSKFGDALHQVAELIHADVGLEAATVDMGGWDLHSTMGNWQAGSMRNQLETMGQALAAFYEDTVPFHNNLTIVVMSEFGRRVAENNSGGTDHGKGGAMMVLGNGINGGQVYGDWPGLLDLDKGDLKITTDYRQVLAELIDIRLSGINSSSTVFPDYTANSYLGLF